MDAQVTRIPVDQCICEGRRTPRPDCWADRHDAKPLTQRQIEHDRSLADYDRALGQGRN